METKKWYQSQTVWSDVLTVVLAIAGFVDVHFTGGKIASSPYYAGALTFLGAMGIHGRVTADTKIG